MNKCGSSVYLSNSKFLTFAHNLLTCKYERSTLKYKSLPHMRILQLKNTIFRLPLKITNFVSSLFHLRLRSTNELPKVSVTVAALLARFHRLCVPTQTSPRSANPFCHGSKERGECSYFSPQYFPRKSLLSLVNDSIGKSCITSFHFPSGLFPHQILSISCSLTP